MKMAELEAIRRRKMEETREMRATKGNGWVIEKAVEFAEALASSPEFRAFNKAREQMTGDDIAQRMLSEFQRRQQSLQTAQMTGYSVSMEQINSLREYQRKLLQHPTIKKFYEAQQEVGQLIQITSDSISQKIGMNYGGSAGAGCC
jgi:cell fate (sporulation/competence/biofilm development) regulator YlbF (YheA/YmcA/DUF963 family)